MKIKPADTAFSLCIRERSNWTCERCGAKFEPKSQGLHCSHHYGRAARSIRWDAINAVAHCCGCHRYLSANPIEHSLWIENHLGANMFEILKEKKAHLQKVTKKDEKEIAAYYRKEHKEMLEQRKNTDGRIEFISYQ